MRQSPVISEGYPGNKRFAFTILDDTDVATRENIAPVYACLRDNGLRTTKTVWPYAWNGGKSAFRESETLADSAYRSFVRQLAEDGFEIASHGATMESSQRAQTLASLEAHKEIFGQYPRVHANHSWNRENIYWGAKRLDDPVLRWVWSRRRGGSDYFEGDRRESPHYWGDVCQSRFSYVRNLTFSSLNLLRINPSMPYADPRRPLVPAWFSTADADDVEAFVRRMTPDHVDELEAEGGLCILTTHFGKGYAPGGKLDARFHTVIEDLGRRGGWFVPVGPMLDWLAHRNGGIKPIPAGEWRAMQWRWALQAVRRPSR